MECITHCHCISHLIVSLPHFTSHHSTSNAISDIKLHRIPCRTIIPHRITHFISHSTSRSTLFHHTNHIVHRTTSRIAPSSISHYRLTYHVTPHSMYSTPNSDNAIYWPHHLSASHHHISHHTTILHISHSCIIPPHLTVMVTKTSF